MKRSIWLLLPLFAVLLLASCGSQAKTVTHTTTLPLPAPPEVQPTIPVKPGALAPPAAEAPGCDPEERQAVEEGKGEAGICAPRAQTFGLSAPAVSNARSGPDVSNNDPFFNWHPVQEHGHPFGYDKVIQGTRFVDSTAAGMASAQRAATVIPGGYDFLEVCRTSASGEARLFASRLKAIGLVGHAFVPMGDAEWPLSLACSPSQARSWLASWQSTLHSLIHRWAGFYTGAWWWNPNVGCWRPPHGALRWVSGYIVRRLLPIPACWGGVDLWQYTDSGFNGVSHTDMSVLETSQSKFLGTPEQTPAQKRAAKLRSLRTHEATVRELHGDIDRHHCRKGKPWYGHAFPRQYHSLCERWLRLGERATEVVVRYKRELHIH